MRIVFFFLMLGLVLPPAYADDASPRSEKGYKVSQDHYLNIPQDMKIQKVGDNVITPEPDVTYLARKLEEQKKQLEEIQRRLQDMNDRLKNLEGQT